MPTLGRVTSNVLLLAGTADATRLAELFVDAGHRVTSSLAGVTSSPRARAGLVRSGGFGGAAGLAAYLRGERFDAVIDATHPFAARMPFNVATACDEVGLPHCRLLRAAWQPTAGDRWIEVGDMEAAAAALDELGSQRAFLAIGRQSLGPFAASPQWFLVRSIEPVTAELPRFESVRSRGPFTVDVELDLLRRYDIDAVVAKNAGGSATEAKLTAARELGVPVVMVARPPQPPGLTVVADVDAARRWLSSLA
jgi:precorrin-6A/cobalt-precorrin-6A reductase